MSKDVIFRKLDLITAELAKLKEIAKISRDEFFGDYTKMYVAERLIEKIVGAAIDVNIACVISKGEKVPDTYYESFIAASKIGVFPYAFAEKIAQSAGMRNKIIHEYESINEELIYASLRGAVSNYAEYVRYVEDYLK